MPNINDFIDMGGWIDDQSTVLKTMEGLRHPLFSPAASTIEESGKGKIVLLYKFVEKLIGKYNVRKQDGPDCVAHGAACVIDAVKAAEIVSKKQAEEWTAETSTEDIYGGSRVNIGKGELGSSGGSFGAWAAKYVNEIGTLARIDYGKFNLSKYNYSIANKWGLPGNGVPDFLIKEANKHKIRTVSLIKTYTEARDALANGYAITIASNQGFATNRDREGFSYPQGTWAHQMSLIGLDDIGEDCSKKRPGVLCQNSWGPDWIVGPKRHEQPDGSFWIDADVLESRILSNGDSWAFSDYDGFLPKKLNLRII